MGRFVLVTLVLPEVDLLRRSLVVGLELVLKVRLVAALMHCHAVQGTISESVHVLEKQ